MKIYLAGVLVLLAATPAWGQPENLHDANFIDKTSLSDPAQAASDLDTTWLGFTIPAIEGTNSPCCWKGDWSLPGESGCHLESTNVSHGTRSDSTETETLAVFARLDNGHVTSMRVVGDQCPVYADGVDVTWLGEVNEKAGLNWLDGVIHSDDAESTRGSALYAMALHRSDTVNQRLTDLARNEDSELQSEAIFWLGEARGNAGFEKLKWLLADLPYGEARQQINFGLAQSGTAEAMELLIRLSREDEDPEQRSGALFWLAQEYPDEAQNVLRDVLLTETDTEVLEQAVFAISQLPDDMSGSMLMEIVRNPEAPKEVRRQALFWMAQSDDDNTIAALTELLTN